MKTQFIITADTGAMTVDLTIKQGSKTVYQRPCADVTEAAKFMLNGIASVMEKREQPVRKKVSTKELFSNPTGWMK